ncbi:MAG: hypothetical protein ACXVED_20515 [Bacteroidia bacterium]
MAAIHMLITPTYSVFIIYILATALATIVRGKKEYRNPFSTLAILFSEVVFTIVGPIIGFMRFDQFQPDIPFAKQHVLTIILFVITSSGAFWLARFTEKTFNPLIRIIVSVGLLQGIILCAFTTIHFLPFIPNGLMFPTIGFELLSPLVAFVLLFRAFYFYNKLEFDLSELLPYRRELGFIPIPFKIFQLPIFQRCFVYAILLIPAVIVQVMLAYGCGQDIDALIKAFTHSYGFTFSTNN